MTHLYEARFGYTIDDECRRLVIAATVHGPSKMVFNDITIEATHASDPLALAQFYRDESERRHQEYINSDLYKQRMTEAAAAEERKKTAYDTAIADATSRGVMAPTWSDHEAWQKTVAANPDDYGAAIMRYAETWARLMEARVLAGSSIADCAEETSRLADIEWITGFQYGSAAQMLCQWWVHGDALKEWRNTMGPCY